MEASIYNTSGKPVGKTKLSESVFGLPWNADLVRGGGKKPWKQKGTGRARHGSTRSPIWVGGGVAHGPRNDRNYDRKINKKVKTKALFTILSRKFQDGQILFVDSIDMAAPKTKEAKGILGLLFGQGFREARDKEKQCSDHRHGQEGQ